MSAPSDPVLVTGATGTTGSRLVAELTARGVDVRAASRSGSGPSGIRFDWYDATTWDAALSGVTRMYLLPPVPDPDPAAAMIPFLDRARTAGVRRAVVHGASVIEAGGPGIGVVQAAVADTFAEWAAVRPSWFMQNVTGEHPLARSIRARHALITSTGAARVGFVDAGDIAAVGAQLLLADAATNEDVVLTGPQSLSYADVAALLSAAGGVEIPWRSATPDEVRAMYEDLGESPASAAFLAQLEGMLATGIEDRTTDGVQRVLGRPARSYRAFAEAEFRL